MWPCFLFNLKSIVMSPDEIKKRKLENDFVFSASRSGGPGGQNVNKVSTKVELRFSLILTTYFSEKEKEILFIKLKNKINNEGELILVSQSERSQLMNKSVITERFYDLVSAALTIPKKRRATRPSLSSKLKRLNDKKSHGIIKKNRKNSGHTLD